MNRILHARQKIDRIAACPRRRSRPRPREARGDCKASQGHGQGHRRRRRAPGSSRPIIFMVLIYISIFVYGVPSSHARRSSRRRTAGSWRSIISSIRPQDLVPTRSGKILGIGLVGLTQYAVWRERWRSSSHCLGAVGAHRHRPCWAFRRSRFETIAAFVIFFLLGYFLYASVYAALAAPFNTEQEAQQFVMIPFDHAHLWPRWTWFLVLFKQPERRPWRIGLSLFPFTAPLIMFMRISVQPGLRSGRSRSSAALMVAAIWAMAWVAGRIYRVGILMYGKKPTLPEIIRWVRYSPGKTAQPDMKVAS